MHANTVEPSTAGVALLHHPGDDLSNQDGPGVPQERVDAWTLEVIKTLFKEKGLQFLAALLRQAQAKQCALPDLGEASCAVISAPTIRALAAHISQPGNHWGYDATQKYLTVLCALRLLYKEKATDGSCTYLFPLCTYSPPATLDALERLMNESRSKVQSFARKAHRRFLLCVPKPSSPTPTTLPVSFDLSGTLGDLEQIVREELGDGVLSQRLLLKMRGALRYRCQSPSSDATGDFAHATGNQQETPLALQKGDHMPATVELGQFSPPLAPAVPHLESPSLATKGNLLGQIATDGRLLAETGDSTTMHAHIHQGNQSPKLLQKGDQRDRQSRPLGKTGDSRQVQAVAPLGNQSPKLLQKGDPIPEQLPANGRLSAQTGDSVVQTGDLEAKQGPNVNVILRQLLDSFLNDNDKSKVIEFLRTVFDEPAGKRGYYHNLYKHGYRQPKAWLAAAVETLIAYQKKTTAQPGKYFYDLCVTFHQQIPTEIGERAHTYGELPYGQLIKLLQCAPGQPSRAMASTPSSYTSRQAPQPTIIARLAREKQRTGMSATELEEVRAVLFADERTTQAYTQRYQQDDGSFALLVDAGATHCYQRWLYSLAECQARLATMHTLTDFYQYCADSVASKEGQR